MLPTERPGPFLHSLAALLVALSLGCSSSRSREIIHEDTRGTVLLERVPDPEFEATHPISLDTLTLTSVLRGIYVRDDTRFLQRLMAGKAAPVRVLSDAQAEFLAPLVTQALTRATPRQMVRFRVSDPSGSPPGIVAGTISAYGLSLYVSLTQYRPAAASPSARSKPGHQSTDPGGLRDRTVLFIPAEAVRTDLIDPRGVEGSSRSQTLVVDYGLLAGLRPTPINVSPGTPPAQDPRLAPAPARTPSPGNAPDPAQPTPPSDSTSEDVRAVQDRLYQQDREIKALREEVQSLQQQLSGTSGNQPARPKPRRSEVPATAP